MQERKGKEYHGRITAEERVDLVCEPDANFGYILPCTDEAEYFHWDYKLFKRKRCRNQRSRRSSL
jgi:hypothetical protein